MGRASPHHRGEEQQEAFRRRLKSSVLSEKAETMNAISPAQRDIQKAAREFVAKVIIPRAAEFDKSGEFHDYLLDAAKPSKIFAMAVPKEYGGLGYSPLTQALVLEEWGYGCAAMGTTLSASILSMESVMIAGNDEQKRRFFTPMLTAGIGAFALTEPTAGSDAGAGEATAVKNGGDYILNGPKCWITNGGEASVFVIFAATDPAKGVKGISAFIVKRGQQGLIMGDREEKLGLRSSNTVYFLLKDARVPAANLLGKEGDGMKIAMQTLDVARPSIGALAVGLAQRVLDETIKFLHRRFPEKTYPGQTLQFKLADMQIQIEGAREAQHHTMALREAGMPFSKESAIAKTLCTDVAMSVASQAVRLIGSHAFTSEFGKFMRDAKVMQIYEGTNQIQHLVIARSVLARPKASVSTAMKAGAK
jgi:alkylation response protein AidB-like acyl-CoA dehydrogenase